MPRPLRHVMRPDDPTFCVSSSLWKAPCFAPKELTTKRPSCDPTTKPNRFEDPKIQYIDMHHEGGWSHGAKDLCDII